MTPPDVPVRPRHPRQSFKTPPATRPEPPSRLGKPRLTVQDMSVEMTEFEMDDVDIIRKLLEAYFEIVAVKVRVCTRVCLYVCVYLRVFICVYV